MKEGTPCANTIINVGNSDKRLTFIERILCKIQCSAQSFINYIRDNFKKVVSVEKQTQHAPEVLLHTADESSEEVKKSETIATDENLAKLIKNVQDSRDYLVLIETNAVMALKNFKSQVQVNSNNRYLYKEANTLMNNIFDNKRKAEITMKEIENAQENFNLAENDEKKNERVKEVAEKKGEIAGLLRSIRTDMIKLQGMLK
ncbi:hypothetical protein REG_1938 [Candidatus Regiella insecticola LSR1]|uniref:Uncharacterized protein n=1 Tax=Candidatus Regiella insecticola LSR1 TaxID=663321 RepID=E0WV23_9ENTR|nr:hypothetical protein REG_1938 [Candidatus Regiella insecticola LSR1]